MLGRRESLRELIRNQHEETLALIGEMHEDSRRYHERREAELERRDERRDGEFREFMREIALRHEKIFGAVLAEMEEWRREAEEGRKQIRANTEAVLRLLDRLGPGGAAA
jgi:hypothetical protein